jgi:N-acetylglucosamine-6-sulfatase
VPPGYDSWFGLVNPFTMYDYDVNVDGRAVHFGTTESDYQTDVLARRAVGVVRSSAGAGRPFLLMVAPAVPHRELFQEPGLNVLRPIRPAPRHTGLFRAEPLPAALPSFDEADVSDKPSAIRTLPRLDAAQLHAVTANYRAELAALQAVDELVGGS